MDDQMILRLVDETYNGLEGVAFPVTMNHLMPTYRALVIAAAANHPENLFLRSLTRLEETGEEETRGPKDAAMFSGKSAKRDCGPEELRILFGQLRIILESLQEQPRHRPAEPVG